MQLSRGARGGPALLPSARTFLARIEPGLTVAWRLEPHDVFVPLHQFLRDEVPNCTTEGDARMNHPRGDGDVLQKQAGRPARLAKMALEGVPDTADRVLLRIAPGNRSEGGKDLEMVRGLGRGMSLGGDDARPGIREITHSGLHQRAIPTAPRATWKGLSWGRRL